jgi:hypothetical protein
MTDANVILRPAAFAALACHSEPGGVLSAGAKNLWSGRKPKGVLR